MGQRALILAGGGSRGAYEIGVWQALTELGITFNMVIGTSVGALNGAVIAQGDYDIALQIWSKMETKMVFDVDIDLKDLSLTSQLNAMKTFLHEFIKNGGASCQGLFNLLNEYVNEEVIRASDIEFGLVTLKLNNMTPMEIFIDDIEQGKLVDYMVASSSCFPAVKAHEIDGEIYVDGGYIDNMPINMAINRGIKDLIVVDLESIGVVKKPPISKDINIKMIKCKWDLGNFLLFDKDLTKRNIRLGYLDTLKSYNAFDGAYYTFIKPDITRITKEIHTHLDTISQSVGVSLFTKPLNIIDGAVQKKLIKFVENHTNAHISLKRTIITCAECCGIIFELSPTLIYSSAVFKEKALINIEKHIAEYNDTLKKHKIDENNLKISDLPNFLKMLNSKTIVLLLQKVIKKTAQNTTPTSLTAIASLFPKEYFAALYVVFACNTEQLN